MKALLIIFLATSLFLHAEEPKPVPASSDKEPPSKSKLGALSGLLKKIDQDGDGKLSDAEKEALHGKVKKGLLERYDADHDGKLSDEEKAKAKAEAKSKLNKDDPDGKDSALEIKLRAELTKRYDKDGNGKLDDTEKKAMLEAVKKLRDKDKEKDKDKSPAPPALPASAKP